MISKNYFIWRDPMIMILTVLAVSLMAACDHPGKLPERPNIIYIMADDLGYGELGCYGQEKIETPHIDRLASTGIRFTDHYSGAPVCAPSRCVLLTGKHSGHAYIRGNDEWAERGDVWNFEKAIEDPGLEGQRPLPDTAVTIGSLLQSAGYRTAIIGKWGLGGPSTKGIPNNMGFDFFYGYNCQRQAHTYFPRHLWKNREKVWLRNELVVPGTKLPPGADPLDARSYEKFNLEQYAPDLMQTEAMEFIKRNSDRPFFLYYASPIPHAPLQAKGSWISYYREKFGNEPPYDGSKGYFPARYPHATYAAMVSILDEQVGEIIGLLEELGIRDNTVVIFTSDNGPTYNGGTDSPWFNSAGVFNSSRGFGKGYLREGGIRVPMIAAWPGVIPANSSSSHIAAFDDVLPTLCDIAGIPTPMGADGTSFLPALRGKQQTEIRPYHYWEYPEYGGQIAIRMGKWKGIAGEIKKTGKIIFSLYNLDDDPQEQNDIAASHPEIITKMHSIIKIEHAEAEIQRFRMKALGDDI